MFAKENSLKKKKDIALVLKQGKSFFSGNFSFKSLPATENCLFKAAFLCSKKVFPKAVQRNKAKRRARSLLGNFLFKDNAWLVFFFKKGFLEEDYQKLKIQAEKAFQKAKLLKQ